ncbi:hypothetical protein BC826DRAFT_1001808 [Russula brevipes]|nr:hypothetical protein BC826DRAFT_1001808 [Russula brevipes]
MSGNVVAAPLSTSRTYQLPVEDPDAPCFVLQINDTGPNAKRQASFHPHEAVTIPGPVEVLVPALSADRTCT